MLDFQYIIDYTMSTNSLFLFLMIVGIIETEKTSKWASLLLQGKKVYQDLAVQTVYLIHDILAYILL